MAVPRLSWRELHWQRPIDPQSVLALLRRLASDSRSPVIVFEARAVAGTVRYLIGLPSDAASDILSTFIVLVPGVLVTKFDSERRPPITARQLAASTRHRAIETGDPDAAVRTVLHALTRVERDEELVLQLVLGPRRVPLAVPTRSSASVVSPWWKVAWQGQGGALDSERRTALRDKVSMHGFACAVRIGVRASSPDRRRQLVLGVLSSLRTAESPGVLLRLVRVSRQRLQTGQPPLLRYRLRLNIKEVATWTAWPLGDGDLPGQPKLHPRPLPPPEGTSHRSRLVAVSTMPGRRAPLGLSARDASHGTWILGPTGAGKSTLLDRLIEQDMAAGHGVIVIEPKGDLVTDVLTHVPAKRRQDVVVLDPTDDAPVGLRGLSVAGRPPELIADGLLSVFKALYADSWGPRTQDILHAGLLTLAHRPDASLIMLPLLLTNAGFRRSVTSGMHDEIALGPFWNWYERLSEAERAAVIAPVMNKLRAWLLNPRVRAVLGQRHTKFDMTEVFTQRKILLVPLQAGLIGDEAARLLGSVAVAQLWQTIQARAALNVDSRNLTTIYVDELQEYVHLPTDLGDALAQSRGLGAAWHLSHQYTAQLPRDLRAGLFSNARSRICFQLGHEDAVQFAKGHPEVTAEDFTALGQYEVYASLYAKGRVTPYASGRTQPPGKPTSDPRQLRAASRSRYGQTLDQIEADLAALLQASGDVGSTGRKRRDA